MRIVSDLWSFFEEETSRINLDLNEKIDIFIDAVVSFLASMMIVYKIRCGKYNESFITNILHQIVEDLEVKK